MNKFIISKSGRLILGNVDYHFELIPKGEVGCYGGGFWKVDEENNTLILSGESIDYGVPEFKYLKDGYRDYKIIYEGNEVILNRGKEESELYVERINKKILGEIKKPKDYTKGLFNNFKFNDGYEVKAKNKKDAIRKHNAWKRKNKKTENQTREVI